MARDDATKRDRVWAALLSIAATGESFTVDAVHDYVDADVSRRTVERTLRGATEVGVLDHGVGSRVYSAGSLHAARVVDGGEDPGDDQEPSDGEAGGREGIAERIETAVDAIADDWADDRLQQRRQAAAAALAYVVEADGVRSKTDVIEAVQSDYPVTGQSKRTWYRKTVRPALKEFGEYDEGERGYRVTVNNLPE